MKRKIGPIDLSAIDSRKGPSPQRGGAPPSMGAASKTMGGGASGFYKGQFGFGATSGGDVQSKMHVDRNANDPMRKDDQELGIDRTAIDPIKFVSAIDSKPIYPPYLMLADFESYLKQESNGSVLPGGTDKKKGGDTASGDKTATAKDMDGSTVTSAK